MPASRATMCGDSEQAPERSKASLSVFSAGRGGGIRVQCVLATRKPNTACLKDDLAVAAKPDPALRRVHPPLLEMIQPQGFRSKDKSIGGRNDTHYAKHSTRHPLYVPIGPPRPRLELVQEWD
jgi:hypothetical protein